MLHNMLKGILFVTVIVFIFMADWRTTVIVTATVPALLVFPLFFYVGYRKMGQKMD